MEKLTTRSSILLGIGTFCFVLALSLYASSVDVLSPRFYDGAYRFQGAEKWTPFVSPLQFTSESATIEVETAFSVGFLFPSRYRFVADDCIEALWVNDERITSEKSVPFCDYAVGRVIDLSPYIHAGRNELALVLRNDGGPGGFRVSVDFSDPLFLSFRLLLLACIALYASLLLSVFRMKKWQVAVGVALTSGILLRVLYLYYTPYEIRAHDPEGHLEYILYIARYFSLPSVRDGWEFYQPPLYYILSAFWLRLGTLLGRTQEMLLRDLQGFALLLSIGTLAVCTWIGSLLFRKRQEASQYTLFLWLLAVFPGLIFFAARINNDVLLAFWMFLSFAFLLRWWQKGRPADWYFSVIVASLGFLTKSNALLLFPVIFACLILKKRFPWQQKLLTALLSLLVIAVLSGWNIAMRLKTEESPFLVANLTNLSSDLLVNPAIENLIEFNPLRMILHPYNNPWSDAEGRQYFWEYLFRSAFAGEFDFGPLFRPVISVLIALALFLLPVTIWGIWKTLRTQWYASFPLWFSALVLLAGHAVYRQFAPYSSSQDFRYSVLLLVPIMYFTVYGWSQLTGTKRTLATFVMVTFVVLSGGMILSLGFTS